MKKELESLLIKYWGHHTFRPKQLEIIESVIQKKNTLALLPTGGGKSLCYQLPAIALEGICIVVSPLIALMQDQVEGLKKRNIKSCFINSSMSKREIDISLDNCIFGNIKLLYISPERLKTEIFIERFKKMNVSFIAVDEAHCISQWGYDFRPSYLNIASLKEIKPELCFIALTATATPKVAIDIQHHLNFQRSNIIQNSFYRSNLSYQVIRTENKLSQLPILLKNKNKSALIYVNTRRKCHEIANFLNAKGSKTLIYHAGLSDTDRKVTQKKWIDNEDRIIVATNAFGMGIDKPDVKTVINFDIPNSIEAYFQEAGRGGRNGENAISYLLVCENDRNELNKRILLSYPSIDMIQLIYQKFCNLHQIAIGSGKGISYPLNFNSFSDNTKISALEIYHVFRILELTEHISITNNNFQLSKLKFLIFHNQLSDFIYRNTKYSALLKLLLRSYSGLFDHEIPINEITIAKRLNLNPDIIKNLLIQLNDLKVISYHPKNKDTLITFLEPRQNVKKLTISEKAYSHRKSNDLNKMKAVIEYAYDKKTCRNKILLNYFGEKFESNNCNCGVCIDKINNKISDEPDKIALLIKSKLMKEPLELIEIIGDNRSSDQQKQITVIIKKMLDADELIMNELNQLQLKQK